MSAHRDLTNAQQALNEAVEAWVMFWNRHHLPPSGPAATVFKAFAEYDQLRRDLDGAKPAAARDTSIATSKADLPDPGSVRRKIIQIVTAHWGHYHVGVTDEELCRRLRAKHQTVSAARRHVELRGWLKDSGERDRSVPAYPKIRWAPTDLALDVMRDISLEVPS